MIRKCTSLFPVPKGQRLKTLRSLETNVINNSKSIMLYILTFNLCSKKHARS